MQLSWHLVLKVGIASWLLELCQTDVSLCLGVLLAAWEVMELAMSQLFLWGPMWRIWTLLGSFEPGKGKEGRAGVEHGQV